MRFKAVRQLVAILLAYSVALFSFNSVAADTVTFTVFDNMESYNVTSFPDVPDPFPDAAYTAALWDFDNLTKSDTQVSGCENQVGWDKGSCTWGNDDVDYMEGSKSLRAVSIAAANTASWMRYNPAGSWDWSKKYAVRFWFKCSSASMQRYRVQISDTDGDFFYYDFSYSVANEWARIEIKCDDLSKSATPLWTIIDSVMFWIQEPAGGAINPSWWVDDVQVREHQYVDATGVNTAYSYGARAPNLPASSDASIVACWNMKEGLNDTYPGVFDDCEDLSSHGSVWTAGNDATVGTTTTKKYGVNATFIKGNVTDNPQVDLDLTPNEDWSSYKTLELWVAPLNDDATPATSNTSTIVIWSTWVNRVEYDVVLSAVPDQYTLKKCQLCNSGLGDPADRTFGSINWSDVNSIRIKILTAADNVDMAFDHILLRRSMTKDATANANHLTLPPAKSPAWATGIDGDALDLERSLGQYAWAPDYAGWDIGTTFTIKCWIKPESVGITGYVMSQYDYGAATDQRSWRIWQESSDNTIRFGWSENGINSKGPVVSPSSVSAGVWFHVAVVASAGTVAVYLNGVAGTPVAMTDTFDSTANLVVGGALNNGVVEAFYDGVIDAIGIYSVAQTIDLHKTNSCLKFDGTNDWVGVPDAASLDGMTAITLSAWVRRSVSGAYHSIIDKASCYRLRVESNNMLMAKLWFSDATFTSEVEAGAVPVNTWTHCAAVWDNVSGYLRVYINGVQVASEAGWAGKTITNNTNPVSIGADSGGAAAWMSGLLDEPFIRNMVQMDSYWNSSLCNVYHDSAVKAQGSFSLCVGSPSTADGSTSYGVYTAGSFNWSVLGLNFTERSSIAKSNLTCIMYAPDALNNFRFDFQSAAAPGTWTVHKWNFSDMIPTGAPSADSITQVRFYGFDANEVWHLDMFGLFGPSINNPPNDSYAEGATGTTIPWVVQSGSAGGLYTVYRNTTWWSSGAWVNNTVINVNVEGCPVGVFNFTIDAKDVANVTDEVIITVTAVQPSVTSPADQSWVYGTTGHVIAWVVTDPGSPTGSYVVERNGSFFGPFVWVNSTPVNYGIDGLGVSYWNFTGHFWDGNCTSNTTDTLFVNVTKAAPPVHIYRDGSETSGTYLNLLTVFNLTGATTSQSNVTVEFVNGTVISGPSLGVNQTAVLAATWGIGSYFVRAHSAVSQNFTDAYSVTIAVVLSQMEYQNVTGTMTIESEILNWWLVAFAASSIIMAVSLTGQGVGRLRYGLMNIFMGVPTGIWMLSLATSVTTGGVMVMMLSIVYSLAHIGIGLSNLLSAAIVIPPAPR